ncbi:MAG: hypothetical protein J6R88_05935, partial [Clostridia bacterium]|nr:hypothetical protein [Clostridia bacterium]
MKKFVLFFIIFITFFASLSPTKTAKASESQEEVISEILNGINEEDFGFLLELISSITGENLTFKNLVLQFLTGDFTNFKLDFSLIKSYILNAFNNFGGKVIIYLLIIGIIFNLANIISFKNNDNRLKNTIYYISVSICVIMIFKVVETVFSYAENKLNFLSKTVETVFPVMYSISGLIGNFGVSIIKPFTAFLSFLISALSVKLFIPLLYFETSVSLISNLTDTVKLTGLKKTTGETYKWLLLLILGLYSLSLGSQSIVNSQYNGISVKILKHLTNTSVPIVGGFLSGGMEVLISSAVLIKNSIGLFSIIAVIFGVLLSAIEILAFSFLIKFLAS